MSEDGKNYSPSYLAEMNVGRKWLLNTPDGRMATDHLRRSFGKMADDALSDGKWVPWDDIVKEYRGGVMLAASNKEAREAFELARHSTTALGSPLPGKSRLMRFFSPPQGYVFRRITESGDAKYWETPINVMREALREENAAYLCVPRWVIAAHLESLLPRNPKSTRDEAQAAGNLLIMPENTSTVVSDFDTATPTIT
jgi:hypothetical protein